MLPGTLGGLSALATRVLLGDSAASELPSNVLDTIVEVCLFARDVSIAHEETSDLWRRLEAAEHSFSDISEQLQRFRREGESTLLTSVKDATRDEMREHGQQAAQGLGAMVDGWLTQYKDARDAQVAELRGRIEALHDQMHASLDRFALPLRAQPTQRVVRRTFEPAAGHEDIARLELLPGLRAELQFEDTQTEQPRRLRSLIGKGTTLQVGTKKTLLRRIEEPARVGLDDLLIIHAEVAPTHVHVDLAKKPGGPVVLRVELAAAGERVEGRGVLPDGGGNALPEADEPVMRQLWEALQTEATRIVASPARSLRYALRDELVASPAGYVNVAERILQHYRPVIRTIMEHSPNAEELTIKVEFGERREEKWILRQTLADHLCAVPETFAKRLSVPEVVQPQDDPDEDKATRAYAAVPVELRRSNPEEDTQDISLTDLDVEDVDPDAATGASKAVCGQLDDVAGEIETVSSDGLPVDELAASPPRPSMKTPPPPPGVRRPKG